MKQIGHGNISIQETLTDMDKEILMHTGFCFKVYICNDSIGLQQFYNEKSCISVLSATENKLVRKHLETLTNLLLRLGYTIRSGEYIFDGIDTTEILKFTYRNEKWVKQKGFIIYQDMEHIQQSKPAIEVLTDAGYLRAYADSENPMYPGIILMLQPKGSKEEIDIAYVHTGQDTVHDETATTEDIVVKAYGDPSTEGWTKAMVIPRKQIVEAMSI